MLFSVAAESNKKTMFGLNFRIRISSKAAILHLFNLSNPFISLVTDEDEGKKITEHYSNKSKKEGCLSLEPTVQKGSASQY